MIATVIFGMRRLRWLAASALLMLTCMATAGAVNAAGLTVSSGVIRLGGTFNDVHLSCWLHVVVQIPPNPVSPAAVHANLPAMDVVATDSFGVNYLAHGAGAASLICIPTDPCAPIISGFMLHRMPFTNGIPGDPCRASDPCKPLPFSLSLSLRINNDGTLNADESSASVAE